MWTVGSVGHRAIIEDGLTLEDGTYVKGFPSFPADAHIVQLKIERLPFLPSTLLKTELETRLSKFGQVLDMGLQLSNRCYTGRAYATLNLTRISADSTPYEELNRILIWEDDDGKERDVFLQWDKMPDFCRSCQASDHSRADCPHRKAAWKCYNCNETGHLSRQCPRNNEMDPVTSNKKRAVVIPPTKERKVSKIVTQDSTVVTPPQTQGKTKEIIQENSTTVMDFSMTDIDQPDYEENVEVTEMPQTRKLRKIAPAQVLSDIEKSADISTYRHFENVVADDGTLVTIERHSDTRYFTKMGDNGQYIMYAEEGKVVNLEAIYPTMTEDIGSSL
jgi:hypothetical protein